MLIGGFQKLSLIDYPNKVSAVVFTHGCLFRCHYCHNPDLVTKKLEAAISEDEILRTLEKRKKMLDAVVVTGGEPTMHQDLPDFVARIKKLGLLVKLDTNGTNPTMLQKMLQRDLLDYVAMDLKHTWDNYGKVTQIYEPNIIARCKESFRIIQESQIAHEFRTTVYPGVHSKKDFITMAGYLKPDEKYFLQNIEYKINLDPNIDKSANLDTKKIIQQIKKSYPKLKIELR